MYVGRERPWWPRKYKCASARVKKILHPTYRGAAWLLKTWICLDYTVSAVSRLWYSFFIKQFLYKLYFLLNQFNEERRRFNAVINPALVCKDFVFHFTFHRGTKLKRLIFKSSLFLARRTAIRFELFPSLSFFAKMHSKM